MKKILTLFFITAALTFLNAQQYSTGQLDSLYNEFLHVKGYRLPESHAHPDTTHVKCGFGIVNTIINNFDLFTPEQQALLKILLERPVLQKSVVTPSGFFKIHYDTTGTSAIKYSLNELIKAADSSLYFETTFLGFPQPPRDGDGYYHIYVVNQGGGLYGYTQFEDEVSPGSGTYHSFMMIDNDYAGYYSSGINGARVTVAHELHHAIQVGNYIWKEADLFFYELTSTAMEEFVFDTVNDYYAYMTTYFTKQIKPFSNYTGYDLAIWNIFLVDKFGYNILLRQWDLLRTNKTMRAMSAIANSILEFGSTFGEVFRDFGTAVFYTNYRTAFTAQQDVPTFEEAVYYPLIKPAAVLPLPSSNVVLSSPPAANSYLLFTKGIDSLFTLVSNSDYISANDSSNKKFPFTYNLYDQQREGTYMINSDYYASFSAPKPSFWRTSEIFNNILVTEGSIIAEQNDFAFPSPFYYSKNSFIFIPVISGQSSEVDLNIYSPSMDLVYSSRQNLRNLDGRYVAQWNGLKENGEKVPTGVYLFVTKNGDEINKGKLVIFNE